MNENRPVVRGQQSTVSRRAVRSAFTLVELLVAMTVMGVLASMVLFALASATESAKVAKTQSTINKLNAIIMAKYESYRTRRVPVDVSKVQDYYQNVLTQSDQYNRWIPPAPTVKPAQAIAIARLDVLRELIRLEMPDGFTDIVDSSGNQVPIITQWRNVAGGPIQTMARPSLNQTYYAAYKAAKNRNAAALLQLPQQAVCLYLIISKGSDDPDVMEQFSANEIQTDPQTMLSYFVDGWGHPIYFLRWAPAYVSQLQPSLQTQHDPFDPLNASAVARPNSKSTFPLYPLIYSAGPDGKYDLKVDIGGSAVHFENFANDPFYNKSPNQIATYIGQRDADNDGVDQSVDNITNHDIE
jgi:prepilin-type N-terminal cleavage/methylation domain-containing protein